VIARPHAVRSVGAHGGFDLRARRRLTGGAENHARHPSRDRQHEALVTEARRESSSIFGARPSLLAPIMYLARINAAIRKAPDGVGARA
jgi:hypothetical protein